MEGDVPEDPHSPFGHRRSLSNQFSFSSLPGFEKPTTPHIAPPGDVIADSIPVVHALSHSVSAPAPSAPVSFPTSSTTLTSSISSAATSAANAEKTSSLLAKRHSYLLTAHAQEGPVVARSSSSGSSSPSGRKKGDLPTFGGLVEPAPDTSRSRRISRGDLDGRSQVDFVKMVQEKRAPPTMRVYTLQEVAAHNTEHDCWMILNGKVYDVTTYVNFHPGGKQKIMLGAGKDGSKLFQAYHPWVSIEALVGKLCIGTLDPSSVPASSSR